MKELPEDIPSWRVWAAKEIGRLMERSHNNRNRIETLEDEVGIEPPDDAPTQEEIHDLLQDLTEGAAPNATESSSMLPDWGSPREVALWVIVVVVGVLALIALATHDVDIPMLESATRLLPIADPGGFFTRLIEKEVANRKHTAQNQNEQDGAGDDETRDPTA